MLENRNFWIVGILALFLLLNGLSFLSGKKYGENKGFSDGYNQCTKEFSPDGEKLYPDPWRK